MNEIFVTVNGTVQSDVRVFVGGRSRRATFRLATAERYFDREAAQWVERETVWMDVVCWRRLAEHVQASVRNGQPVIVRGRLRVTKTDTDGEPRQGLEVQATSVGHDLALGLATFSKSVQQHRPAPSEPPRAAAG